MKFKLLKCEFVLDRSLNLRYNNEEVQIIFGNVKELRIMKRLIALCSVLCLGLLIILTGCKGDTLPSIEGSLQVTIFKTALTIKASYVDTDEHDMYNGTVKSYVILSTTGEEAKEISRKDITIEKPSGDDIPLNLTATALDFTGLTADTTYIAKLLISSKGQQKTLATREIKTLSAGESEDDPILIDSLDMLLGMNKTKDAYYKLTKDIDCGGSISSIFNSSSTFSGTLDGDGHRIFNFSMESNQYTGLFGYMSGATIKNLVLEDVSYSATRSNTSLGALAGYAKRCVIENVFVNRLTLSHSGQSSSSAYIGGLVGQAINCTITNCSVKELKFNAPLVRLKMYVGGLVGENKNSLIEDCSVEGTMEAICSYTSNKDGCLYMGGFSGVNDSNQGIKNSYAKVDLTVTEASNTLSSSGRETFKLCVGGFNGGNINDASRVERCVALGDISVTVESAYFAYIGGFAGFTDNQNISTYNFCMYVPKETGLTLKFTEAPKEEEEDKKEIMQQAWYSLGIGKIGDKNGASIHTMVYEEIIEITNEHEKVTKTPWSLSKDLEAFSEEIRDLILAQ